MTCCHHILFLVIILFLTNLSEGFKRINRINKFNKPRFDFDHKVEHIYDENIYEFMDSVKSTFVIMVVGEIIMIPLMMSYNEFLDMISKSDHIESVGIIGSKFF